MSAWLDEYSSSLPLDVVVSYDVMSLQGQEETPCHIKKSYPVVYVLINQTVMADHWKYRAVREKRQVLNTNPEWYLTERWSSRS